MSDVAAALLRVPPARPLTGRQIRQLRRLLDLTQGDAAELVGVALNTWSRWEREELTPHPLMAAHLRSALERLGDLQRSQFRAEDRAGWSNAPVEHEERELAGDAPRAGGQVDQPELSQQAREAIARAQAKRQRQAQRRLDAMLHEMRPKNGRSH